MNHKPETRNPRVKLVFMGPLKRPSDDVIDNAIHTASTTGDLMTKLGYPEHQQRFIQVFVEGRRLDTNDSLPEAAEITLFLPMGGG